MEQLSAQIGARLRIKRDGLTHPLYGGNKIRKFEFVFGDVLRKRARVVLTGGGLGSHHTLAIAVVARQFGIQPVCAYYCQPVTGHVRRNLLMSAPLGIDAHFCGDYVGLAISFAWQYIRWLFLTRRLPYFVYPGASGTLGTLGYVNAAMEIKMQLEEDNVPEPEAIFVAVGSCGTFAGLLLGAKLCGLGSRIVGVRIIEENIVNRPKIARLVNRAARYLKVRDPSVPAITVRPDDVELLHSYVGPGYAHVTDEGQRAVQVLARTEGIQLETTYTAKAMAALLDHASHHPGSALLFVNTYAENPALPHGDYHDLPWRFWPVFDASHKARCWCLRSRRNRGFCSKATSD
jgi:D-cysteine desulfhydrase